MLLDVVGTGTYILIEHIDNGDALGYLFIGGLIGTGLHRIVSSLDAVGLENKKIKFLNQKYNISILPTYNVRNNGVGIGFAVNF